MAEKEKIELLTSFVDGEINDPVLINELESLIASDSDAAFNFNVQSLMKKIVQEKIGFINAPEKLKKKVKRKLLRETESPAENNLQGLFSKPYWSYATAAVIVLAVILIIFNRPPINDTPDFAIRQRGSDNMLVQAQNNFKAIVDGNLKPAMFSDNPEEIKNYFQNNGVGYKTTVPVFENLKLLGAVISDEDGEKFAHHVYTNSEGNLVYLYQVTEQVIIQGKKIILTSDLVRYLDEGRCYSYSSGNTSTLIVKVKENICTIVSDLKQNELSDTFCNLN